MLFRKLSSEIKKPLQIMIGSEDLQVISFIEEAGFVCKRKCFELEVSRQDNQKKQDDELPLSISYRGSEEYDKASQLMFGYYKETHESVSPLTCNLKDFKEILPGTLYFYEEQGIVHGAFTEENEIAYLFSIDQSKSKVFCSSLVEALFKSYESIFFEADHCDETAMELYRLFEEKSLPSYNTYIRN